VLKPILGDGIFLAESDEWVTQRRLSGMKFQGGDLRQMAIDMSAITSKLVDRWKDLGPNGRVDVTTEMAQVTLEIVLKCLFNVDAGGRQADIYWALTTYLREAEKKVWNPVTLPDWAPTKAKRDCRRALQILDDFVHDIIAERRASGEPRNDLLQLLVDAYGDPAENGVSPTLLRDQVLSFILAGHETSANALSWAFCLLSQHPDAAQRLTGEVTQALAGRTAEISDFPNLRYTKMVLDEALRLYPPVWTISRTAVDDDQIGNFEVKKGTNVMLCAYAVHREARLWADPERFDPTRFDTELHKAPEPYAYFPFGAGVRSCLGSRFAVMEALIVLATIAGEFSLHLAPGQVVEPEPMITLRPRGQIFMDLERVRGS
jgi:cytochrome P450